MAKFEYGNAYKAYDMRGDIKVGKHGLVRVHDIFNDTPEFMKRADVVFVDPPGTAALLSGYYTKAEKTEKPAFNGFIDRLFEVIREINPKIVFMELFPSTKKFFLPKLQEEYKNIKIINSMYYHNPKHKCWVAMCTNENLPEFQADGMDEQDIIKKICTDIEFSCIADPCMGQGLVGFYAEQAGKDYVGTELNYKRLAVLRQRVDRGRI